MKWTRRRIIAISGAVAVVAVVVVVVVLVIGRGGPEVAPIPGLEPSDESRQVTEQIWPATLALHVELDAATQANQPADVALVDGNMFVADTGGGRLVEVSPDGKNLQMLDKQIDPKLALSLPMAIASNQGQLYIADSGTGRVVIAQPSGAVSKVITLTKGDPTDSQDLRPIGLAVWSDGSFVVSDANNDRLLKYSPDGTLLWSVGTGKAGTGDSGFNVPSGVTIDKAGNVYVVDMLNSQVKKYSPDGTFLLAFGQSGDGAGLFARPKAVAVDDAGNIYVSDGLQAAVQVFNSQGAFVGFIGRKDPADPNSTSLFNTPHGMKIIDGKLYVVDRFAGLFVFDLPTGQAATAQPSSTQSAEGTTSQ